MHETVGTQPVFSGPTRIIAAPTAAAMPSHQVLVQQQPQLHQHHQFLQPVPQQIVRLPNGECSCHVAPPPPPRVVCRQIDPCEESQMAAQAYQQAAVWNYQDRVDDGDVPKPPGLALALALALALCRLAAARLRAAALAACLRATQKSRGRRSRR